MLQQNLWQWFQLSPILFACLLGMVWLQGRRTVSPRVILWGTTWLSCWFILVGGIQLFDQWILWMANRNAPWAIWCLQHELSVWLSSVGSAVLLLSVPALVLCDRSASSFNATIATMPHEAADDAPPRPDEDSES
jgi:hypothetical protein